MRYIPLQEETVGRKKVIRFSFPLTFTEYLVSHRIKKNVKKADRYKPIKDGRDERLKSLVIEMFLINEAYKNILNSM